MALNLKQKMGAKLLAEGYSKAEVSRQCKVNPKTVYNWLENGEFTAEVERHRKTAEKELLKETGDKMGLLFDNLLELALKSKNESVRYNATTYLIDRQLGKPTTRNEEVSINKESAEDIDIDDLLKDLDNVIELKEVTEKK